MFVKNEKLNETIEQQRQELLVQMHLANMEAQDEWNELEKKLEHMRARGEKISDAAVEAHEELGEALFDLGHEISKGYKDLIDLF